jgi:hypothetical protein
MKQTYDNSIGAHINKRNLFTFFKLAKTNALHIHSMSRQ